MYRFFNRHSSSRLKAKFLNFVLPKILAKSRDELKDELRDELRGELRDELRGELRDELRGELRGEFHSIVACVLELPDKVAQFCKVVELDKLSKSLDFNARAAELRQLVRLSAGLSYDIPDEPLAADLMSEFRFLMAASKILKPAFVSLGSRRVIFSGQAYYNAWYLSRALRSLGWKADVYNWDTNPATSIYYHGEDFRLGDDVPDTFVGVLKFYLEVLYGYNVIHFTNPNGITFGGTIKSILIQEFGNHSEIFLLKSLGKKIVYSNNGCLDGVSQSSFSKWGPDNVCAICRWQNEPNVCSDVKNLAWGRFRNSVADFQCTLGGNRADYNDDPRVHEVPEFYCLDSEFWHPDIQIPESYRLHTFDKNTVRLYHAVGNKEERTNSEGVNIKSSHVYLPLIESLQNQGLSIELISPTNVPNREVRFLQAQMDICLDMLSFGWFGANVREAMMLGKPVVCFIRPEWLESLRKDIPEYAEELPIVSATPNTIEEILRDLIFDKDKRLEIGRRSRAFAVKWHSAESGGRRFDMIYSQLLGLKH